MHLKELDANLVVVLDALLIDASVTKAAERLGRSPSAVSHALANLRHIFDDELFVRAGQRLTPTVKAKELAPTVHIIVSGLESLLRPSTPFDPATQERVFLIACSEMAELYFLPALREDIADHAPEISLERISPDSSQFLESLRQGRIDFALIEGKVTRDVPDVQWDVLKRDAYITLMKQEKEKAKRSISLSALQQKPHVLSQSDQKKLSDLELRFLEHKIPEKNIYKVSSSLMGQLFAFEMDGLVTVPRLHADVMSRHISVAEVQLPFELPLIELHLGWHRSFDRDECHQWLRERIQFQFSEKTSTSESRSG